MFNKFLSNIGYNPSAISAFVLYSKRLKVEKSIRKLGLLFLVLSLLVQILATVTPSEKSLTYSENHIINGIKTRDDILQEWDRSGSDIPAIYSKFGVKRQDIANLSVKPNSTIKSESNNNYWGIGRSSLSGYSTVDGEYINQELSLNTDGPTIYMRPLHSWDIGSTSTNYKAFKGRNSTTGKDFWILADSGGYTQIGRTIKKETPSKPELTAKLSVQQTDILLKSGDTFQYLVEYRNKTPDSLAENVQIQASLDDTEHFEIVSPSKVDARGKLIYNAGNLTNTNAGKALEVTVRLKKDAPNGTKVCNLVKITSSNAGTIEIGGTSKTCIRVVGYCYVNSSIIDDGNGCNKPGTTNILPPAGNTTTVPEPAKQDDLSPSLSKTVKNATKNLAGNDALNTVASPGDVIEYTLTTYNSNPSNLENYVVKDYIGDVLDYADIDTAFLTEHGGTYDKNNKEVTWGSQSISANSKLSETFRATIKNPIPSTNRPSKTSTNFDCKISNLYGDETTLAVSCPTLKNIEKLPNTSAGTAIGIGLSAVLVSAFFFARAGLLAKESTLIKRMYQRNGQGL